VTAGDPFPLDGKLLYVTAKLEVDAPDSAAVFQKNTEDDPGDFEISGDNNEIVVVNIDHEDTEGMTEGATLEMDLQTTDLSTEKVNTVWRGKLPVSTDVTHTSGIT